MIQKSEPLGITFNYKELQSNVTLLPSGLVRNNWKDFLTSSELSIASIIKRVYTHIFPVSAFLQPYTSPNPPLPIILCTLKSFMVSCKCKKQTRAKPDSICSITKTYCKKPSKELIHVLGYLTSVIHITCIVLEEGAPYCFYFNLLASNYSKRNMFFL